MLVAETRIELQLDADGSHSFERALGFLGGALQLDPLVRIREGDGDAGRAAMLRRSRAYLKKVRPLAVRLLRGAETG